MFCGFETIGNATLICHDSKPVLVTDPWITGDAYFGSWALSHEIPKAQYQAALDCEYVWFSHGHPDHLNGSVLPLLKGKKILLPDHVGGRVASELKSQGFDVRVLQDRKWVQLSKRLRVVCIADQNQDATLFIDLNNHLILDTNDAVDFDRDIFVRKIIDHYKQSYMLSISGFGNDADMCNFFDEAGNRILPADSERRDPIGPRMAYKTDKFGAKVFIPFSCFHKFQRSDSEWATKYIPSLEDIAYGYRSNKSEIWPAFIRVNCETGSYEKINPAPNKGMVYPPTHFGDDWNDKLLPEEKELAQKYFKKFEHLHDTIDYINLNVGGEVTKIEFNGARTGLGITFETPRNSLVTTLNYEIFDDLLVGNFMKATLHGAWPETGLYPDFSPYVTKYGDNGRAFTKKELAAYFAEYDKRSIYDFWTYVEKKITPHLRKMFRDTQVYGFGKGIYQRMRSHLHG